MLDSLARFFPDWVAEGVNHTLPGNGGQACVDFLPPVRKMFETALACTFATVYFTIGYKTISDPVLPKVEREDRGGRRLLLVLMCLVFGTELGFKFSSKTMIYALNPCHVVTLIQIYLLAAPPTSKTLTYLFRFQLHAIYGALLALLFPVLNTRLLPMEAELYWIQHGLMLVIPFYLMRTGIGGVFTVEPLKDMSWAFLSAGIIHYYHFILLQGLGIVTKVNLNSMVCPAISDPFYGPNYRLWAIGHQSLLILFIGKIYTAFSLWLLQVMGSIQRVGEDYIRSLSKSYDQICGNCGHSVPVLANGHNKKA